MAIKKIGGKAPVETTTAKLQSSAKAGGITGHKPVPSFMKVGAAAKQTFQEEEAKQEAARAEAGKAWRFMMKAGESAKITFLDGKLNDDGMLDCPMFREHTIFFAGRWRNFVCTAEQEACPLCEQDDRPSLVGILTVLDHRKFTSKKDGHTVQYRRKLYVAKRQTLKQLMKFAEKKEGSLVGMTFEMDRTDKQKASVGDIFTPESKFTLGAIREQLGLKPDDVKPLDYAEEIVYHTRKELLEMGLKGMSGVGDEPDPGEDGDVAAEL